jgi:hypothetical protein
MITSIRWSVSFGCVVVSEDVIQPNFYDLSLSFVQNTNSEYEQQIALERVKTYFSEALNNCVLIDENHQLAELFESSEQSRVMMLPGDPGIQLVTMALLEKIKSIVENKLLIEFASISSTLTGALDYSFDPAEFDPRLERSRVHNDLPPWWKRCDFTINDYVHELDTGETTIRAIDISWEDVGLGWAPHESHEQESPAEILPFKPRLVSKISEHE